jgi:hypothetical protein
MRWFKKANPADTTTLSVSAYEGGITTIQIKRLTFTQARSDNQMSYEPGNFWNSEKGLLERIGLLGDQIQLGTYNNAVKVYATAVGATDFTISGDITATSCAWCAMHVGQTYHRGQFMPDLPRHPWCIHTYDVERIGAAPNPDEAFAAFWGLLD